jgi:hypothetical protein
MTDRVFPEYVFTYLADETHVAPKPFSGHSLVGSLSSRAHDEIIPKNGLSGSGHLSAKGGHIGIGAAYHQNLSFHIGH